MYGRLLRLGVLLVALMMAGGAWLALTAPSTEASPAAPNLVREVEQPDGTVLRLRLWGDEFVGALETLDGYTVQRDPLTGYWEYAVRDAGGQLVPSGVVVGQGSPPAPPHLRHLGGGGKGL